MSTATSASVSMGVGYLKKRFEVNRPVQRKFCVRAQNSSQKVHVGILGASGYTGGELVRLIANHPHFQITLMTADRKAGESIRSVFHNLHTLALPDMVAIKDANLSHLDAVFSCLPHGTTQEIIRDLPKELKIVDLSADFRLRDVNEYEKRHHQPHKAPELQEEAVYGLTEVYREEIRSARLVANPGCYPTSVLLPLIPLLKAHLIDPRDIIIDAKSAASGAGRGGKEENLYTEVSNGARPYGFNNHPHVPEIEQVLSDASHSKVTVRFTPNMIPANRGILSNIYVNMATGVVIDDLRRELSSTYEAEEFVWLWENEDVPQMQHVQGSNLCFMNVFPDRSAGRAQIISVIDNLGKGASGQALQNLNLMMGYPENMGLQLLPLFP